MADFREEGRTGTGLLGHTLRLAMAVLVTGIFVVLLLDRDHAATEAHEPQIRDVTPASSASATTRRSVESNAAASDIVLRAGTHGHFLVDAQVNGETLRFLVDTGASSIFLTPQDAAKLGWTPNRLTFSERYDTAGGEIRAAPVELRSLRIGQMELYDLPASVGEQPGSISLLGMTFLKRLESYQVRGDTLVLTW